MSKASLGNKRKDGDETRKIQEFLAKTLEPIYLITKTSHLHPYCNF